MIIKRSFEKILEKRLSEPHPLIQVIIGPRQVGKTTAVKNQLRAGGVYQTADSPTPLSYKLIETWWKEAEESEEKVLAIDEIQKIEGWAEVIS